MCFVIRRANSGLCATVYPINFFSREDFENYIMYIKVLQNTDEGQSRDVHVKVTRGGGR